MDSNAPAERPSGKSDNGGPLHLDRIAKNTSYMTAALVVQKVLSFAYFAYIARVIGAQKLELYLSALAITTVFGIFIDLGLTPVLIRETAKKPEHGFRFLENVLSFKVCTAILAYAAVLLYVLLFHYSAAIRSLVAVSGLIMIMDSFVLSFYATFRGFQILKYEAIGTIINKILVIAIGIVGLKMGLGVRFLVWSIFFGSLFNLSYAMFLLVKKLRWRPRFSWDATMARYLGVIAVPFAVASIFVTVYGYLDQLFLSNPAFVAGKNDFYLAWYGTAYKLTYALQFLPAALVAAIFPAMSSYFHSDRGRLTSTLERALSYLIILAVPIATAVVLLAEKLIVTVYGNVFRPSILPLQILIVGLVFIFMNYPVGYLLNAANRQTRNTIHIGIALIINFVLNFFLIPRFTYVGAAVSSAISSLFLLGMGLSVAGTIAPYDKLAIAMTAVRAFAASAVMALVVLQFRTHMGLPALLPLALVVYFIFLLLFRGITVEEGVRFYKLVRHKKDS